MGDQTDNENTYEQVDRPHKRLKTVPCKKNYHLHYEYLRIHLQPTYDVTKNCGGAATGIVSAMGQSNISFMVISHSCMLTL